MAERTNGLTGRNVYSNMTRPQDNDNINSLCRRNQSLIFHFRTGHARVNSHLNRISPHHPPMCRHCLHPNETAEHLLTDCPSLSKARKKLLQSPATIANSLYGSLNQLQKTCTFLRMALCCQE